MVQTNYPCLMNAKKYSQGAVVENKLRVFLISCHNKLSNKGDTMQLFLIAVGILTLCALLIAHAFIEYKEAQQRRTIKPKGFGFHHSIF